MTPLPLICRIVLTGILYGAGTAFAGTYNIANWGWLVGLVVACSLWNVWTPPNDDDEE